MGPIGNSFTFVPNQTPWTPKSRAGNRRFLTRRLWGCVNEPPYFHHSRFTTLREAILAHSGEALRERLAFQTMPDAEQDTVVEFLKTLQVLPAGTRDLIVDQNLQKRSWAPDAVRQYASTPARTH